jgi:hypothetical protein
MTDIFVNRQPQPPRGRIVFLVIAAAAVLGLAAWAFFAFVQGKEPATAAAEQPPAPVAGEAVAPVTPVPEPPVEIIPQPAPAQPATLASAPRPTVDASAAGGLLADARNLVKEDRFPEARDKAQQAFDATGSDEARDLLGEINMGLLISERPMEEKIDYTVQSGDTLGKLASRYGTTIELIAKANGITGQNIRINDRMRIFTGKFAVKVNKTDNILDLFMNDRFFKRYRVGTGQYSKTPVGTFKVVDRIAQPTWYRDDGKVIPFGDPENLLGTHWLALDVRGYGIHGTWEPQTIGKQASAGCVRLLNDDVEQLYTLLPVGTPVTIED